MLQIRGLVRGKTNTAYAFSTRSIRQGTSLGVIGLVALGLPFAVVALPNQAWADQAVDTAASPDTVSWAANDGNGYRYAPGTADNVVVNVGPGTTGGLEVDQGIRIDQKGAADTVDFNVNSDATHAVTITNDGSHNGTTNAIDIESTASSAQTGAFTLTTDVGSTISTTTSNQTAGKANAIFVQDDTASATAAITITSNSVINARADGIHVNERGSSSTGTVTVTNSGAITAGAIGSPGSFTGDAYADDNGISVETIGGAINITTDKNGTVDMVGGTQAAIWAKSITGAIDVDVGANVGQSNQAAGGSGVLVLTGNSTNSGGAVDVTLEHGKSIYSNGGGIVIGQNNQNGSTVDAHINVTSSGLIRSGGNGIQIGGFTNSPYESSSITGAAADSNITIITKDGGRIDATAYTATDSTAVAGGDGVLINTRGGANSSTEGARAAIDVTLGDTVKAQNDGVAVTTSNGNVSITTEAPDRHHHTSSAGTSGGAITAATGNGIVVNNTTGSTTVTANSDITAATTGGKDGIKVANGSGAVTVKTGDDSDILAASGDGINAGITSSSATTKVDVEADGDIGKWNGAVGGKGIVATNAGLGAVEVDTGWRSSIHSAGNGIDASITNATNQSALTVDAEGRITVTGATSSGLVALNDGLGNTTVTTHHDIDVSGSSGDGVSSVISNALSGATNAVTVNGDISVGSGIGIYASTNGAATSGDPVLPTSVNHITTGGRSDITSSVAGSQGIVADATQGTGNGSNLLDLNGDIDTAGTAITVKANAGALSTVNIDGWSDIGDDDNLGKLVISSGGSAGEVAVNNSGELYGTVDFTGASKVTFVNSDRSWNTSGTSTFSGGDDTLTNSSNGGIYTGEDGNNTTFAFGGGNDTFNNDDYFEVNKITTLTSLEHFNAADGDIDMWNGDVGDKLVATSTDYNTGLTGDTSELGVDVDLASSSSDTVEVGSISGGGTTDVYVNPQGAGKHEAGIVVVTIDNGTSTGAFQLADGPLHKGLWDYDMFSRANGSGTDYYLASYANGSADNLATLPSVVSDVWYAGADDWIGRSGDLRNAFRNGDTQPLGYAPVRPVSKGAAAIAAATAPVVHNTGVWGNIFGSTATQASTVSTGNSAVFNTGYSEAIGGADLGIDFAVPGDQMGGTFILGLVGSYAHNAVTFTNSDTATVTAPSIGGYVDWMKGGTYVDAMVKADFASIDYNIAGTSGTVNGTAVGGMVEAGTKMDMDKDIYVEPVASVSYVHTDISTVTIGLDDVTFGGDSLRAKVGGRLGTTLASGGMTVNPFVSAFVGNEFQGGGTATLSTLSGDVSSGSFTGIYGELGAGVNLTQPNAGISAFAQGSYTVAAGYNSGTVKAGLRGGF